LFLSNKNIKIPLNKQIWGQPLPPTLCYILPDKGMQNNKASSMLGTSLNDFVVWVGLVADKMI
jgi:hypothetical protein